MNMDGVTIQTKGGQIVTNFQVGDVTQEYPLKGTVRGIEQTWTLEGEWLKGNVNQVTNFKIEHRLDLVGTLSKP